jgi:hypothetical protein
MDQNDLMPYKFEKIINLFHESKINYTIVSSRPSSVMTFCFGAFEIYILFNICL